MKSVSSLNNKSSTPFNGHLQEHLPTKKQLIQMNGANVYVGSWERKSYWCERITTITKTYFL